MASLMDTLGSALSAPGDYTRGALMGNFGERASGRQLLDALLGALPEGQDSTARDIGGFGLGLATDPLNLLAGLGGLKVGKSLFGAQQAAKARLASQAALGEEAAAMGGMGARFRQGAENWTEAGKGIDRTLRNAPVKPEPPMPSMRAKDFADPNSARTMRKYVKGMAEVGGVEPTRDVISNAREGWWQQLAKDRDRRLAWQEPPAPPGQDYGSLLTDAATKSNQGRVELLKQLLEKQNAPAGLLEEGFLSNRLSPLEKAMLGGTTAGAVGGGIYTGLNPRE